MAYCEHQDINQSALWMHMNMKTPLPQRKAAVGSRAPQNQTGGSGSPPGLVQWLSKCDCKTIAGTSPQFQMYVYHSLHEGGGGVAEGTTILKLVAAQQRVRRDHPRLAAINQRRASTTPQAGIENLIVYHQFAANTSCKVKQLTLFHSTSGLAVQNQTMSTLVEGLI